MENNINIKNPYIYTVDDFKLETIDSAEDLCDSSGYLTLSDQISIITNQSEVNAEFRRGMIDNFNDEKMRIISLLSDFEEDDYVNDQLHKARSGDLLDKETILQNAYNNGYNVGFYPSQRNDSEAGGTPTLPADDLGDKPVDDVK